MILSVQYQGANTVAFSSRGHPIPNATVPSEEAGCSLSSSWGLTNKGLVPVSVPALDAKDLSLHRDGVRYPLVLSRKGNARDRIRTKCSIVIFLALKVQDAPIVYL